MPWMERAREVLSWSEWLRHRLAAGGTKPSSLAGVYVTAVAVIAMPHSPRIWCSSGSRPCLLLCPPCCETCSLLWLPAPVAGSHSEESGWPTFVCPYPISQLWQLCVWRHKSVCVWVCLCVFRLKICDVGKAFSFIKTCTLFVKSSWNFFILKFILCLTRGWAACSVHTFPNRQCRIRVIHLWQGIQVGKMRAPQPCMQLVIKQNGGWKCWC